MNMRLFFLVVILLSGTVTALAQETVSVLDNYIAHVRSGKYGPVPNALMNPQQPVQIMEALKSYQYDTTFMVRSKVYFILRAIGLNTSDKSVTQKVVERLVEGIKDDDAGNAGEVLQYLTQFRREDFSDAAKDSLRSTLNAKPPHLDKLIRLIGFLQMVDVQPKIMTLTVAGVPDKVRWSAQLALARMGDETMINRTLTRVSKMKVNDDVVYDIFPDLIYMRQRPAIQFMVRAMDSDEKNCESADAENNGRIPCAYRIMEMLAPVIDGYPLKLDASGDIKTRDYPKALDTVRKWFRERGNDYKIIDDVY